MARVIGTQDRDAQRQAAAQQAADRAAALAERQAEFRQREADRAEAQKFREQSGRQTTARNLIGLQSLRQARKEGSATRSEQQKDRESAMLEQLTNSGMLAPGWEKTASPLAQAARNRILQNMNLNPAAVPEDPKLAAMRAEVAKSGKPVPGQVPPAQVPASGTPLPQTPTQGPAASGDDAMDRAMMQAVASLSGGEQQQVNPALAAQQAGAAAAVQRREALAGAGPVHFDPNLQANVRTPAAGGDFVVGAPDPSVGAARGSQYAEAPGGGTAFLTPEHGYVELGAPRDARAAQYRQAWMERNAMTPFKPSALTGGDWTSGVGHIGTAPAAPEKPLSETALPNILPATTGTNAGGAGRGVGQLNQPAPPGTPEQAPPGSVFNASTPVGGPVRGFFRSMGIRFPPEVAWDPNDVGKQNAWNVPPYRRGPEAGVQPVPETQHQFAPSNLATPPTAGTGPFGHPVPSAPPEQQPIAQNAASPLSPEQRPPPLNQQQPIQPIRPPIFF